MLMIPRFVAKFFARSASDDDITMVVRFLLRWCQ